MIHATSHPLAGQTVTINAVDDEIGGQPFRVEDWWDRVSGSSWMFAQGNPACLKYAVRGACAGLPTDDQVVYGKVGHLGHIVHVSELGEVA